MEPFILTSEKVKVVCYQWYFSLRKQIVNDRKKLWNVVHSSYQAPTEILGIALDSITNQFPSSCDETGKLPPLKTPEEDKEEEEIQKKNTGCC